MWMGGTLCFQWDCSIIPLKQWNVILMKQTLSSWINQSIKFCKLDSFGVIKYNEEVLFPLVIVAIIATHCTFSYFLFSCISQYLVKYLVKYLEGLPVFVHIAIHISFIGMQWKWPHVPTCSYCSMPSTRLSQSTRAKYMLQAVPHGTFPSASHSLSGAWK